MFKIVGIIKSIGEEQQISDQFVKREFVIQTSEQYPQILKFQAIQGNTAALDNFDEGETVTVHFNLKGREWTGDDGVTKVFNTLEAWKIESYEG